MDTSTAWGDEGDGESDTEYTASTVGNEDPMDLDGVEDEGQDKEEGETSESSSDEDSDKETEIAEDFTPRRRIKLKSRLSQSVEFHDDAYEEGIGDSGPRLRDIETRRNASKELDDDMPTLWNHPVRYGAVTPVEEASVDGFMGKLDEMKRCVPAMYHRFCSQVMRHYYRTTMEDP